MQKKNARSLNDGSAVIPSYKLRGHESSSYKGRISSMVVDDAAGESKGHVLSVEPL